MSWGSDIWQYLILLYCGVMHAQIWQCYIIVQALSSSGFKIRPRLPPRQGLTTPLPPWRGLWPSRIGTAWASALPSLPAADTRVTNWAERRSAGDTGEGDSEGEGNTWPAANLLCTLSLTHYFKHPSPTHTYLFIFYTQTHWLSPSHSFLCASVLRHASLLFSASTQLSNTYRPTDTACSVQQGQLCNNNHVVYTRIMTWDFQQTKHSQHNFFWS